MIEYIEREEAERLLYKIGAPAYAIHGLALVKAANVVSRAAYEQVCWERNIAIEQLRNDYGVGLGQKKPADLVEV